LGIAGTNLHLHGEIRAHVERRVDVNQIDLAAKAFKQEAMACGLAF
jgi:hypothetical protein